MSNPLIELEMLGQSIWYDNIRRALITSGELQAMVDDDGLTGVTSNPAIFEKAIAGSTDYDPAIKAAVRQDVGGAKALFERLAIEDIQLAADVLYPVYTAAQGQDGFVSFEVSPYLANDTAGTIEEAHRLHAAIARENVLIKVPATAAGIAAIEPLIGDGIRLNVTLLFSLEVCGAVAEAYVAGLERLSAGGGEVSRMAGVASFFLSRIDTLVDERLSQALDATRDSARRSELKSLVGKVAIASAKLAYARNQLFYSGPRWQALADQGAHPQRLLWASTGTKNPKYPKTLYVDELIGPDTVNTIPTETFNAYRASGNPQITLTANLSQARETLATLDKIGISIAEITDELLGQGVQKFSDAFDKLLSAVEMKRQDLLGERLASQTSTLGEANAEFEKSIEDWRSNGKVRRLWNGDASLWTNTDEDQWLGWLHVVESQIEHQEHFRHVIDDSKREAFRHVVVLGMGGSSLCTDVLGKSFGPRPGFPELVVLDSTVPAQVATVESQIDPARTLFIVSSKSGGTTEPNVLKQFFFEKVRQAVGDEQAGTRFIAITDPGTKLHQLAKADRFRAIAHGIPSIGGRYSALSNFGMIPAAVMGIDVPAFLDSAETMVQACASCVPPDANPGVSLGVILGTLARQGRDKATIIASPSIATLGDWLEQLIAESTGKEGRGIVPIAGEMPGAPDAYGKDRVFVYLRLNSAPSPDQDTAVDALEKAGQPIVRITLEDAMDLGQEFFRWEIATAVASSVIGINAFNQPDVEASKIATKKLTMEYEQTSQLPQEAPFFESDGIKFFAGSTYAVNLTDATDTQSLLASHLAQLQPGDYFAINAYVEMNAVNHDELQAMRHAVRDQRMVATTVGYGPRFLHSTGQLHKGGPNSGVFLQITSDDAEDLPIPDQRFSFGILKQAQALGDFEVLVERERRALRVHLGADVPANLAVLREALERALRSE